MPFTRVQGDTQAPTDRIYRGATNGAKSPMPRGRTADDLLARYAITRALRDAIREARDGCLCERHEGVDENMEARSGAPCWKAARQWKDEAYPDGSPKERRTFYFDPPIDDWCPTCRRRQAYTEQLRVAVRDHASAKRAILQRGRALATSPSPAPQQKTGPTT